MRFFSPESIAIKFISCAGIFVLVYLCLTLYSYPLFPFQMTDIDWTREWLIMTIVDYYGAVIALSGIVALNETPLVATLWIMSFCLLGSPFCCSYVVYR